LHQLHADDLDLHSFPTRRSSDLMINIKSIWETQKPTGDTFIRTKIDDIPHLNCFAATNHITGQHLYIMSVSKNVIIPELKNFKLDRKSTRLNSSHVKISYAVFCL